MNPPEPTQATPPGRRDLDLARRRRAALGEVCYLLTLLALSGGLYLVVVLGPVKLATHDERRRCDETRAEVVELERRIARLRRDAQAHEADPWAVERALRRRMGFLRAGERTFAAR